MLAVDVQVGPPLARPVDRLGHRQLLGVGEKRHPAAVPLGDRLALGAAEAADDGGGRIGAAARERAAVEPLPGAATVLVGLGGHQRAHVRPDPAGRGVHVDDPGRLVSRRHRRCGRRPAAPGSTTAGRRRGSRPRARAAESRRGRESSRHGGRARAAAARGVPEDARVLVAPRSSMSASSVTRNPGAVGEQLPVCTSTVPQPRPMAYVELHCHSAYSFLDGASHPEELVVAGRRARLPRARADRPRRRLRLARVRPRGEGRRRSGPSRGAEVTARRCGAHLTLLVESSRGYANLCRILTAAHAGTRPEGKEHRVLLEPAVALETVAELNEGLVCLSGCARDGLALRDPQGAARLAAAFGRERFFVELQRPYERGDARRHAALRHLAEHLGVETVATGNVHAHSSRRTLLQDALVAIRCRTSLDGCERERRGNREAVLRPPGEMVERFAGVDRAAAERTVAIAERLQFDLTAELGYRYPDFSDRADPAIRQLAAICEHAFTERYAACAGPLRAEARTRFEGELALIGRLGLAGFFLLHHEVLELARACALEVRGRDSPRMHLPPGRGRGSSVGSIVCYLTGLSHVDPVENRPLARALPERGARGGARHRPRLPARDPGEADRPGHRAVRARARGARRELRDVPLARRDPRRRQGARPPARGARAARPRHRRLERRARRGRGRGAPGRRPEAPLTALARVPVPDVRDRAAPAARLPAPGRDGDLLPAARRARPRAARCDGGTAALPVGQGLVLRRGVPEDRPARARDALVRRGVRRPDRGAARGAHRPLADPARRPGRVRRDPGGRHRRGLPDREPRPDAEPPPHEAGDDRRPHDPGRARPARGRSRGRRCTRTSSTAAGCGRTRRSSSRSRTSRSASRSPRRSGSSSSRTRCSTSRSRSRGTRSARPRASAAR